MSNEDTSSGGRSHLFIANQVLVVLVETRVLHCTPPQKGVVSDERGNLAIRTTKRDTLVDTLSEVGDSVLEVVVSNLHDICKGKSVPIREL